MCSVPTQLCPAARRAALGRLQPEGCSLSHLSHATGPATMLRQASQAPQAHTSLLALQDLQPSLREEQAAQSTPSKEHAILSTTMLEQETEVRTPSCISAYL